MAEKHLYFCNILVSRWVNALQTKGLRLQHSLQSGMDQSSDQSSVQSNAQSYSESNSFTSMNSSPVQPNGQGSGIPKLPIKSILVVKWDEIGDMAAAVHVFGTLKSAYPEAELHVLCKPFVSTLIAGDPAIDKVFTNIADWQQRYDVVVELRGTWQTLWKSLSRRTMPKYRVDRGWVQAGATATTPPVVSAVPINQVSITGRLRLDSSLPRGSFFALPGKGEGLVSELNAQSQLDTEKFYIDLLSGSDTSLTPEVTAQLPELSDGPHMAYALQWIFFAGLVIYGRILIRRTR